MPPSGASDIFDHLLAEALGRLDFNFIFTP